MEMSIFTAVDVRSHITLLVAMVADSISSHPLQVSLPLRVTSNAGGTHGWGLCCIYTGTCYHRHIQEMWVNVRPMSSILLCILQLKGDGWPNMKLAKTTGSLHHECWVSTSRRRRDNDRDNKQTDVKRPACFNFFNHLSNDHMVKKRKKKAASDDCDNLRRGLCSANKFCKGICIIKRFGFITSSLLQISVLSSI